MYWYIHNVLDSGTVYYITSTYNNLTSTYNNFIMLCLVTMYCLGENLASICHWNAVILMWVGGEWPCTVYCVGGEVHVYVDTLVRTCICCSCVYYAYDVEHTSKITHEI